MFGFSTHLTIDIFTRYVIWDTTDVSQIVSYITKKKLTKDFQDSKKDNKTTCWYAKRYQRRLDIVKT